MCARTNLSLKDMVHLLTVGALKTELSEVGRRLSKIIEYDFTKVQKRDGVIHKNIIDFISKDENL